MWAMKEHHLTAFLIKSHDSKCTRRYNINNEGGERRFCTLDTWYTTAARVQITQNIWFTLNSLVANLFHRKQITSLWLQSHGWNFARSLWRAKFPYYNPIKCTKSYIFKPVFTHTHTHNMHSLLCNIFLYKICIIAITITTRRHHLRAKACWYKFKKKIAF